MPWWVWVWLFFDIGIWLYEFPTLAHKHNVACDYLDYLNEKYNDLKREHDELQACVDQMRRERP